MLIHIIRRSLIVATLFASAVLADSIATPVILIANYDAKIKIATEIGEIQGQVKVRDHGTFPIEFQNHRLEISVLIKQDNEYTAELNILEKADGGWYSVNTEAVPFSGFFEIPVEITWSAGDVSLDVAIAMSPDRTK